MITPDTWAYTNRLAAAHPGEKCLLAALMLTTALSARSVIPAGIVFCLMSGLTMYKAGIPAAAYGKILLAPFLFISLGAATILIDILPGSGAAMAVSSAGFSAAAAVFCRALGATSCLLFLCLTTPVTDIVWLLGRLRLPELLLELVDLTYRCIFILADAADKIIRAQASRLGYGNMGSTFRSSGLLAGAVLIRSFEHARLMQQSFDSRCGGGPVRSLHPRGRVSVQHIIFMLLAAIVIAATGLPG